MKFSVFDKKKAKGSGMYGRGFYFTDSAEQAAVYGNRYSVYLDVKHPLQSGGEQVSRAQMRRFLEAVAENEDYSIENYGTYDVEQVLQTVMGSQKNGDAFKIIQYVGITYFHGQGNYRHAVATVRWTIAGIIRKVKI